MSIFHAESHCIIQQVEKENPTERTLYSTESGKTEQSQLTERY